MRQIPEADKSYNLCKSIARPSPVGNVFMLPHDNFALQTSLSITSLYSAPTMDSDQYSNGFSLEGGNVDFHKGGGGGGRTF